MQARIKRKRLRCKVRTVQMLTRRGFLRTEPATMRSAGATPSQSAQERATLATTGEDNICTTGEGNPCHRTKLPSKCSFKVGRNLASWCL